MVITESDYDDVHQKQIKAQKQSEYLQAKQVIKNQFKEQAIRRHNSQEQFGGSFTPEQISARNSLMQKQELRSLQFKYLKPHIHRIDKILNKDAASYEDIQRNSFLHPKIKSLVKPAICDVDI